MKKHPRILRALACAACLGATGALPAVDIDGVAAIVGSETILTSDVNQEIAHLGRSGETMTFDEMRNQLIERKLILKAAGESKMTMQDWVVDSRIREIVKKSFGGDRNKLMETLAKQKMSYPEWNKRMKEDMIVQAMRWQVVDKNIVASPAAMRKEYKDHPDRYSSDAKVSVSVILLKPEDRARRELISQEIKTRDFADLAKTYSADSHASDGGLWKDVDPREVFRPEVCDEISRMPRGTISHWLDIDGWSYLFRKESDAGGQTRSFAEAYDDIEANVREAAARAAYNAWIERLRAETYIKIY